MTKAYINYPNPHVTVHGDASCGFVNKSRRPAQRRITLSRRGMDEGLEALRALQFRAEAGLNDVWITFDFDDAEFEESFVVYARSVLGRRYRPLREAKISRHC